jgi:flagellar hook-associated protein 2
MSSITSATTSSTAATTATSTTSSTSSSSSSDTSSSTSSTNYATTDTSSIDWDGLIDELYQAKLAKADTYETKITANEAKISAYEDAASLLSDLEDAVSVLRAPSGTLSDGDDVFEGRTAYLTAVGGADTDSTLSVTVDDGADTGTYSLTVQQLATAHKVASSSYASSSEDLNLSGTITLGIEGGDSVSIDIDEDMSLADIAQAINDESDASGVQATVLKISDSSYELVLTTVDTGETITATDGGGVLTSLGVLDDDGAFADELQASQDAIFALDGVSITRSSNDVDDVLDGVTLHLYSTTDDGQSITVEVGQNLSDIKDAVIAFVDAYNAYRDWALTQQETSSAGGASSDAVLFGDSTIRGINTRIASALNFDIDETSLATLGITFNENNELEYDEDTLDDVLLDDSTVVQNLFAYSFDSSSSDLRLLARGTGAPESFSLEVTVDDSGDVSGVTVNGESGLFYVDGTRIKGVAGTEYEGYTFVYTGDTSQTIDVTQHAGIAEQLYNVTVGAIDSTDGSLTNIVSGLSDKNDDYQDQIDRIEDRAETYKTNLTARYARIQAAIAENQSTLDYLQALLDSQNSS